MLTRLHHIPSLRGNSSSYRSSRYRTYHPSSYFSPYHRPRQRNCFVIRGGARISKRQFSSKCSHSAKSNNKSSSAARKPPPLRPPPLRPPPLTSSQPAKPPPLRPNPAAGAAPRRIRRSPVSIEDSVARLFAPDMAQEVQVRKFEDAFDKVTREAIARENARAALRKFFEETYDRINTVDLPAIAKETKEIRAQVRAIESEITERKDKDVSQSIMDRLASFIQQGLGEQQEAMAQKIESMPGFLEDVQGAERDASRTKSRKEVFDMRRTAAPSEQEMTPIEDVWREEQQIIDAEYTARRAMVERQLHIIDLEAILADHAQDILMINSSVLKIEMKLDELARREKKSMQKAQEQLALAAVLEQRRTALNEFWAATNAIPRKIELRSEVYNSYQEKSSDWAGSVDDLTDALKSAIDTFQTRAGPLQESLDKILALKGPILDDCHQHRRYLRRRMRFDKSYCVDPSAWDINNVGRSSLDILQNTIESLNHRPGGLKNMYPTTVVERYPSGSIEKTKLAREVKKMRAYLSDLYYFGNELHDTRELLLKVAMRKFRHSLQNDELRLKQLEMIGPFTITMGIMMRTMGTARWIAFDQKKIHASLKGTGADSSSRMDEALRSRLLSDDVQPFLKFYYKTRQLLASFNVLLDEFVELSWERLKFEAKFPEFQQLTIGTRPKSNRKGLATWQKKPLGLQTVSDPLEDRQRRDIVFTKWANAMKIVQVERPVDDDSSTQYYTNSELQSIRDIAHFNAPITSAAAYQMEQFKRTASLTDERMATSKLKEPGDATRSERVQRGTTVETHAGAERSYQTSITREERVETSEMTAIDEMMSEADKTSSLSSTSIGASASKFATQPNSTVAAAPEKEAPVNTRGFMFAKRVGAQLRNVLFGASPSISSPPVPPAFKPQSAPNAQQAPHPPSPLQYFSYRSYKDPSGNPVTVHYLQSLQDSEKICSLILSEAHHEKIGGGEPVIGFDMEWKMNASLKSSRTDNLSVIQLATPSRIAIIHLSRFKKRSLPIHLLAPSLKLIMESESILKCGVNIKADCTRFTRVLEVVPRNIYEISLLYRLVKYSETDNRAQLNSKRPVQLAAQIEETLGVAIDKSDNVRLGEWSNRLNFKQTEYAASDAFANLKLFEALEIKRQLLPQSPERPLMESKTEPKAKEQSRSVSPVSRITKAGTKKQSSPPKKEPTASKKLPIRKVGGMYSEESVTSVKEGVAVELPPIPSIMSAPKNKKQGKTSKTGSVKSGSESVTDSSKSVQNVTQQSEIPLRDITNQQNEQDELFSSDSSSAFDESRSISTVRRGPNWRRMRVVANIKKKPSAKRTSSVKGGAVPKRKGSFVLPSKTKKGKGKASLYNL